MLSLRRGPNPSSDRALDFFFVDRQQGSRAPLREGVWLPAKYPQMPFTAENLTNLFTAMVRLALPIAV